MFQKCWWYSTVVLYPNLPAHHKHYVRLLILFIAALNRINLLIMFAVGGKVCVRGYNTALSYVHFVHVYICGRNFELIKIKTA